MKKITFILVLLVTSLGFGQTIVEDFDPLISPTALFFDAPAQPLTTFQQIADPTAAGRGNVLHAVTRNASVPWQGGGLVLQGSLLDLTDDPFDLDEKKVKVWVFSNTATPILAKVTTGAPDSATDAFHGGTGWEELTFDFQFGRDGTGAANGIYQRIIFFLEWNSDGICTTGCFPPNSSPRPVIDVYIDEISFGSPVTPGVINWTGATNSDWNTPTNWDTGAVPGPTDPVNIPNVANDPTAGGAITVASISIESGASFIADATVAGPVTYERDLSTSNWYYVSSPVVGANVDAFVLASGLETQATFKALCAFDTNANNWVCYQDGSAFENTFVSGKGYIVNLAASAGTISFSGTMNTGDESIALDTAGSRYNLLGNPYPSFIDTGLMLPASTTALETQTIWVFNASTNSYETKVTADNFQLAPGQGFFIRSNVTGGNVAINEAFQIHPSLGDTFLRSPERTEVYLTLSDGSSLKNTRIYYIDGTTTGFDNGFDGPMFRAFADPFSIYTHLVTDGIGRDMGVQSIPNDFENLVVPVGITASAGTEISISASPINLPDGLDLYLEDRTNNTFTLLDANSEFRFTPSTALNGVGRFYLHTSSIVLGVTDNVLESNIEIYTSTSTKELIIKGQWSGATTAELFNIEGKLVLRKSLDPYLDTNVLDVSGLGSGVYVINIDNTNQSKTQKVILK